MVRELQEKLQLHREFRSLGVVLGGYDLRMEEQSSFFRKLGFEPLLPCPESPLMWPRVDPSVLRGTLFDLPGT